VHLLDVDPVPQPLHRCDLVSRAGPAELHPHEDS
jgi:hypothetical protein